MARQPLRKQRPVRSSSPLLVLIGTFKLVKALLLIVVGIGLLKYLHRDLAAVVMHWTRLLRVDPENRVVHGLLVKIFHATPKQVKELRAGTFIYAGLFSIEGIGLLLQKRWAEYFTIITTGGLIPLEIFEVAQHFSMPKVAVLAVNALILIYLVKRVRSR